jgi:hypothetical protein
MGEVITREQWLVGAKKLTPEQMQRRKTDLAAVHRDQETVRFFGNDIAIVSHRANANGTGTRQTDIWVRQGGNWRLAHGQITKIQPLPPRTAK